MTPRTTLPIREILIGDRQRKVYPNIPELAESIRIHGLIQPLVVDQDKNLIAGGRRLAACQLLGLDVVDVVYKETMDLATRKLLEAEENLHRENLTWQEQCISTEEIHYLCVNRAVTNGEPRWTQARTSYMLGYASASYVNSCLAVAPRLKNPKDPINLCDGLTNATKFLIEEKEIMWLAEIARREKAKVNTIEQQAVDKDLLDMVEAVSASPDLLADERTRYESNPLNTEPFDEYWKAKTAQADEAKNSIYITNRFIFGDCLDFMRERPNVFDHIITDIPYGIDMDMLDQDQGGMAEIDLVRDEHDIDQNKDLISKFYKLAFHCTKDRAYVVTWCDIDLWDFMKTQAEQAGFVVQRWPITWVKTHSCSNQAAQFNYTKNTEIAMVARKPLTTLTTHAPNCVVTASNIEMRKLIGHPFAKPLECWEKIVKHCTSPGQLILEPFAGRGSGVLSMLRLGMNVMAVECNEAHYNALVENMKQLYYLKQNPKYVFK